MKLLLLANLGFALALPAIKGKKYPKWGGGAENGYDCPSPEESVARIDELMFKSSLEEFTKIREKVARGQDNSSSSKEASCYDWYTDVCTHSPDHPLGFDFVKACYRHDFGWFNYHHQHAYTESNRKAIEAVFLADLHGYCETTQNWLWKIPCKLAASFYVQAVELYPPNKAKHGEDDVHIWRPVVENQQVRNRFERIKATIEVGRKEGEGSPLEKRQMNTEGKKLFPILRVSGEAKDKDGGSPPEKRGVGDTTDDATFFEKAKASNEALQRQKEAEQAVEAVKQAEAAAVAAKQVEVDKIANAPSEAIRNDNSGMGKLGQDGPLVRPEKVKEKSNFRKEWDADKAKRKARKKIREQAKIDKKAKKAEKARLKKLCGKKGKKGGKGGKDGEAGNDEKTGESGKPDEC